jgi:hypothetical protein
MLPETIIESNQSLSNINTTTESSEDISKKKKKPSLAIITNPTLMQGSDSNSNTGGSKSGESKTAVQPGLGSLGPPTYRLTRSSTRQHGMLRPQQQQQIETPRTAI